ncbi:mechanosensitive ion channel domain-containing protein [Chitinibacteraceae bacterium HSL-7]
MPNWLPATLPHFSESRDLIASALFIVILLTARALVRRSIIRRDDLGVETKRRWLVSLRNTVIVLLLVGMTMIWAKEIQTLAVSLVAIAAAIVLATKEMILCMMGSIYRTSTHAYSVGDRIEVAGFRGQVIDTNLLSTALLESSHGRGTVARRLAFPNSLLLSNAVYNETALGQFVMHSIALSVERSADWEQAEHVLMEAALDQMSAYRDELAHHALQLARNAGLEAPAAEPRIRITLTDREAIDLQLQLPVPLGQRAVIEQRIVRAFLTGVGQ